MRPANTNTITDCVFGKTLNTLPLGYRMGLSIYGQSYIAGKIINLTFTCCPPAVVRLVVAIVVNAVYGHTIRTLTHIDKKGLKRTAPALAYCDASTAVSRIILILGIFASLYYGTPNFKSRRFRFSMNGVGYGASLYSKATAREGSAFVQIAPTYNFLHTTFASAIPIAAVGTHIGKGFYKETSEALTGKLKAFRHGILRRCSERLARGRQSETAFRVYSPIHAQAIKT